MNDYIKIKHPELGYVEFRAMTNRQMQLLKNVKRLQKEVETLKKRLDGSNCTRRY